MEAYGIVVETLLALWEETHALHIMVSLLFTEKACLIILMIIMKNRMVLVPIGIIIEVKIKIIIGSLKPIEQGKWVKN
jgi:hypothetical protein